MIQQSILLKLVGASLEPLGFQTADQSCLKTKLRQIQCNSSTAFRDAAAKGYQLMFKLYQLLDEEGISEKFKFIHIVLTDADDNSSKITQSEFINNTRQMRQKIPKDKLKTIYIGVDLQNNQTATNQLNEIVREGGNNTELHQINSSSIQDIFQKIQVNIGLIVRNQTIVIEREGVTVGIQKTSYQPVASVQENNFVVLFTLDVSGSMSGSKWNQVCQAVDNFLNILGNSDLVLGIVFNDKMNIVTHMDVEQKNQSIQAQSQSPQKQYSPEAHSPKAQVFTYTIPNPPQSDPECKCKCTIM